MGIMVKALGFAVLVAAAQQHARLQAKPGCAPPFSVSWALTGRSCSGTQCLVVGNLRRSNH